jgi:hypothetical protein
MAARRCHPWQCVFRALSDGVEREGKSHCQRMNALRMRKYLIAEMPDDRESQQQWVKSRNLVEGR